MTKELEFIKVKCGKRGHVNLVPVVGKRIAVEDTAKCEKWGRVIVKREK